jgi:hypothetical protein
MLSDMREYWPFSRLYARAEKPAQFPEFPDHRSQIQTEQGELTLKIEKC